MSPCARNHRPVVPSGTSKPARPGCSPRAESAHRGPARPAGRERLVYWCFLLSRRWNRAATRTRCCVVRVGALRRRPRCTAGWGERRRPGSFGEAYTVDLKSPHWRSGRPCSASGFLHFDLAWTGVGATCALATGARAAGEDAEDGGSDYDDRGLSHLVLWLVVVAASAAESRTRRSRRHHVLGHELEENYRLARMTKPTMLNPNAIAPSTSPAIAIPLPV